jgi:hypothetical protein
MGNDNIFVAANLLKNVGLEFHQVGFTTSRSEVPCECSFKNAKMLSNVIGGLIRHPLALVSPSSFVSASLSAK